MDQDLVEGLCHQCRQWVPVSNVKRKNSVLWYRHAHKVREENEHLNDHGPHHHPISSVMYTTSLKPVHPRSDKYGVVPLVFIPSVESISYRWFLHAPFTTILSSCLIILYARIVC